VTTTRVMTAIAEYIGAEHVYERAASMGGEDFSRFGRTVEDIPTVIFWTGSADPKAFKAGLEGKGPMPPANHSPFYAPQPEPALKTGVTAMTAGALELFGE